MTFALLGLLFSALVAMIVLGVLGLRATTTGTATTLHALAHGGGMFFAFMFIWLGVDLFLDLCEEYEIKLSWSTELAFNISRKLARNVHIVGPVLIVVFVVDLITFRLAHQHVQTRALARAFSAIVTGLFAALFAVLLVVLLVPHRTIEALNATL